MINSDKDINQKLIIYKGITLTRYKKKFQAILVDFNQCSDIAYYSYYFLFS